MKKLTITKKIFILILLVPSFGCVSQAEGRIMHQDIAKMRTKYEILNRKLKNNQNRIDRSLKRIDTKLADLDITLTKAKKLLSRNNANFDQDLVSLENNIQTMNGKNAEMISKFEKLEKDFDSLKSSFSELRGTVTISENDDTSATNPKEEKIVSKTNSKSSDKKTEKRENKSSKAPSEVTALYSYAYRYVTGANGKSMSKKDRLSKAIDLFESLIQKYGTHPKANSARYWITQCYFAKADYSNSYKSMNKFVNKYPKSKHIPQILYQMGFSLKSLNHKKDAKKIFKTLIKLFPKSSYAKKAQKMI